MEIFGWGRKNTADVTVDGKLKTDATTYSEEHDAALNGDAYTMDIDNITSATAANWLAVIKNTHSTDTMVVTCFHIAPNTDDVDQEMEVYLGGTFSYLAEGTAVIPCNMLASKSAGAQGDFYVSDSSADIMTTIVAGSIAGRFAMPNNVPYTCSRESNWVLPPDTCFMLRPTKDEKFRGFITFYYHATH